MLQNLHGGCYLYFLHNPKLWNNAVVILQLTLCIRPFPESEELLPLQQCGDDRQNQFVTMAKKTDKTNAARLLDKAGIRYDLIPYEFDENDLAAWHVADSLGQDIAQVFKTLVLHGDRTGHIVCVVPGNMEVNLKALAKVSGNKKVEMIPMKDLLAVTGYIRGGCSPIGMKKRFPTYFHSTVMDHDLIYVSAGVRGLQIEISPDALIRYVGAAVADVAVLTDDGE